MDCKKTALFFMLTAAACFFSCRVDIDGTGQMGGTGDSGEKPEDPSVEYNVSHLLQNINDDGYTEADFETLSGKPDCMTEAVQKDYEGFILKDSVPNCKISSDGSTIVKIHYDRKLYEVVFDAGEGVFKGAGENGEDVRTVTRKFRHGQKIEPPEASSTKDGYKVQWPDFGTAGSGSVYSYTASWESGLADYGIRSYFESVSGDFEEAEDKRSVKSGKPGTETSLGEIDAQSFTGFTFDHADNTVISEDGTSFVSFYYKRNYYTLTFDAGNGKFADGKSSVQKSFKYGQSVEIPEASREGYTAIWTGVPNVCPAENAKYTATWKANENTPYKIKHFLMNVDGKNFTVREPDSKAARGKTDSQTNYGEEDANSYEGFSFLKVENTEIAADGSSCVKFYYRRNYYTVTFVAEGGTFDSKVTLDDSGNAKVPVIYEGTVESPGVSREGYSVKWPDFKPCTENATYTATWIPDDVEYTVEHWRQNANDDEYTLYGSPVKMTGKPGTMTKAAAKGVGTGFIVPKKEQITQLEIAADGSTVVKIYYNRKTYDITFDAGDGVFLGAGENGEDVSTLTKTYRYYQKITAPKFFKDGYVGTWSPTFSATVKENVAYTVTWEEGDPDTNYNVYHIQQATNGNYGTTPKEKETRTGLGGSMTKFTAADAKSYTGFTLDRIENTIISSDGKAIVKFYYKRNIVKLTFDAGEGTFSDGSHVKEFTGLYDAAVSVEKPTRDFWICTAWFLESSTAHLDPEFGYKDITKFPVESTKYEAKWDATFKLTAAKDDKGNDVLSNFSTQFETGIEIHDQDFKLNGGSNPRWLSANPTIIGCRFYHKDASKSGDDKHYNAFWATNGDVNLAKHKITGTFYGQKMETDLSDDYNTITFTIACKGLYTDRGGGLFGLGTGYPFGKNGSYTLTFTRK